jgi:spore coat polysaccharide biosynthesis protein SpsF
MSSTRLPGKVLADICGRPVLQRVVERVRQARRPAAVVVATSTRQDDDAVADACRSLGIDVFRGPLDDVLLRYALCAEEYGADPVVRITADCPLIDPDVIDLVVERYSKGDCDYVGNTMPRTFPTGLDTEVFSRAALLKADREARLSSEREHVTPFIWKQPGLFRLANVPHTPATGGQRWVVDKPEDLEFVRAVYSRLGEAPFRMDDVLELLERHPEIRALNAHLLGEDGYATSLSDDARVEDRRDT